MKVLVVDDDYSIVMALQEFLDPPHTVIGCMDPMDALDHLDRNPDIEAIISDWMMPGLSGLEVLTVVQQRFPLVRRILTTAAPNEPEVREAMRDGLVQFLIDKPWSMKLLRRALE